MREISDCTHTHTTPYSYLHCKWWSREDPGVSDLLLVAIERGRLDSPIWHSQWTLASRETLSTFKQFFTEVDRQGWKRSQRHLLKVQVLLKIMVND
jgi:hypothetical protein